MLDLDQTIPKVQRYFFDENINLSLSSERKALNTETKLINCNATQECELGYTHKSENSRERNIFVVTC